MSGPAMKVKVNPFLEKLLKEKLVPTPDGATPSSLSAPASSPDRSAGVEPPLAGSPAPPPPHKDTASQPKEVQQAKDAEKPTAEVEALPSKVSGGPDASSPLTGAREATPVAKKRGRPAKAKVTAPISEPSPEASAGDAVVATTPDAPKAKGKPGRKSKSAKTPESSPVDGPAAAPEGAAGGTPTPKPKAKRSRKPKAEGAEGEEGAADGTTPKPKAKAPRKPKADGGKTPREAKKGGNLKKAVAALYSKVILNVNVRHWDGTQNFRIPIKGKNDSISDFLETISEASGIAVDALNLMHQGKTVVAVSPEGKELTLFSYDINVGNTLLLMRPRGAAVEDPTPEPCPAPASGPSSAAEPTPSSPPAASPTATSQPSEKSVDTRIAVGMDELGIILCEQPPGTVHNTDAGLPEGVVTRWGRMWSLAVAPGLSEPAPSPVKAPVVPRPSASAGDSEDDYVPAGDDIVTSEDDSASEGGDVGEPLPPPTTAGECEDNLGLISVGGSADEAASFLTVMFTSSSGDKVTGVNTVTDEPIELSVEEAITAIVAYRDAQSLAKPRRRKSSKKSKATPKVEKDEAPASGKGRGRKKKQSKAAAAAGFVEFHFVHNFAAKSKMPTAGHYRLLWRELPPMDLSAIEDDAVREAALNEDEGREFAVVAKVKITHGSGVIVAKANRRAIVAGEYTLGLDIQRNEAACSDCLGNDEITSCQECGCPVCLLKAESENTITCEECSKSYHYYCLSDEATHLTIYGDGKDREMKGNLPEAEFMEMTNIHNEISVKWCCGRCNTRNQVSAEKAKKKERLGDTKKGWGGGLATMGRMKECPYPTDLVGRIPGIPVGTTFASRNNAAEAGVHRSQMGGIHGRASKGAFAICQSAGYANEDEGEKLLYRGQGGRNLEGNKRTTVEQTKNQDMKLGNAALAKSMELNTPVRVMRGAKLESPLTEFAPVVPVGFKTAYRYDGLYKVLNLDETVETTGVTSYRFTMEREDDEPAPWSPEGRLPYAKHIVTLEKMVRQDIIKGGFGADLLAAEASCYERIHNEPLPGAFSGLPLDADLDEEEARIFAKLDADKDLVERVLSGLPLREVDPNAPMAAPAKKPKKAPAKKKVVETTASAGSVPDDDFERPKTAPVKTAKAAKPAARTTPTTADSGSGSASDAPEQKKTAAAKSSSAAKKPAAQPTPKPSAKPSPKPTAKSVGTDVSQGTVESDDEPVKPQQKRAAAAKPQPRARKPVTYEEVDLSSSSSSGFSASDSEEEEVKEPVKPAKKTQTKVVEKKPVSPSKVVKPSARKVVSESEDGDSASDAPVQKKKLVTAKSTSVAKKPVSKPSPKRSSKSDSEEYEEAYSVSDSESEVSLSDDSSDSDFEKRTKGKKQAAPRKQNAKKRTVESDVSDGTVESDDEPVKRQKKRAAVASPRLRNRKPVAYEEVDVPSSSASGSSASESEEEEAVKPAKKSSAKVVEKKPVTSSKLAKPLSRKIVPSSSEDDGSASDAPVQKKTAAVKSSSAAKKPAALPTPLRAAPAVPAVAAPAILAEDAGLVAAVERDSWHKETWDRLRATHNICVRPLTTAKIEAVLEEFKCSVTQYPAIPPCVSPRCCKYTVNVSEINSHMKRNPDWDRCLACNIKTVDGSIVKVGSSQFPVNSALGAALTLFRKG